MASLKQIKSKTRSVGKTRQVTRAMEAVSAAKMRKAQSRTLAAAADARAGPEVLARAPGARELYNHPLTRSRTPQSEGKTWPSGPERPSVGSAAKLYIVITSDKGLAGALNSGVLRAVNAEIANSNASIIAIGRK